MDNIQARVVDGAGENLIFDDGSENIFRSKEVLLTGGVTEAAWEHMRDEIYYSNINIIGTGGNINKLYRLIEKKEKKQKRIKVSALQDMYDRLLPYTPEERMEIFNLKADRADVIIPAGRIFLLIAETIKAEYVYVPVIGLADGIIDSLYEEDCALENTTVNKD